MNREMLKRSQRGQAVALPLVILALMVVVVVGMMAFEVERTAVAREQLHTATESAALAAAATLAGSASTDISKSQSNAVNAALEMFKKNEIFGASLSNTGVGEGTPASGEARLSFQFLDPSNNNAPVPAGDPKGKAIEVKSIYGLEAMAGKVIGLGDSPVSLSARATGGVGQLDVVLCFDCAASMRLNTTITRVRRTWNNNLGKVDYIASGSSVQNFSGGMKPQLITSLNAPLRGANDNSRPGNFPPGTAADNGFTDMVCNIDENSSFGGFTDGEFDFPNLAALVEASRGNLENESVFEASGASTALAGLVTPKAGYKDRYFALARKHTHPWIEAQDAATNFFTLMNNNTRAHFGFVAFQEQVGQNQNTLVTESNVGPAYPAGGIGQFPLPAINLSQNDTETNVEEVASAVDKIVPDGGTNIGGAIERATRMFDPINNTRPNTKKVIILFTDGVPTAAGPLSGNPIQNCQLAAGLARQKGIAVFTVGLAHEPGILQQQATVLNMITTTAGNGGRFFQVTDASKLNNAFASIARNLTQIVQ